MIEVKVRGADEAVAALRKMAGKAPKAVAKGMTHAALELEGTIREVITEKFPDARTGELARSYAAEVVKTDGKITSVGVFSDLIYAKIQDEGGTIYPRNAKALAIPLKKLPVGKWPRHFPKDALTFYKSKKGNALLVDSKALENGKIDPVFVLKSSSTITGKRYLDAATERAEPKVLRILADALADAMGGDRA